MSGRKANENRYKAWIATENDGRLYTRKVAGKHGWYALYLKEVDENENIIRFWQEIYDTSNVLKEIHEKYPVDKGHQKIEDK